MKVDLIYKVSDQTAIGRRFTVSHGDGHPYLVIDTFDMSVVGEASSVAKALVLAGVIEPLT